MTTESELTETIDRLERQYPHLSEVKVPSGMTRHWLLALGLSYSALDDTPFSKSRDLPDRIRLKDDLVVMRNLLRLATEEELLRTILEIPRVPGDLESINAPNLGAALDLIAPRITRANKLVGTKLSFDQGRAEIAISVHAAIGSSQRFFELIVGIILYRIIRSFLEFSGDSKRKLRSIVIETFDWDKKPLPILQQAIKARLASSKDVAKLTFPSEFLASPNPNHDPNLWATLIQKARIQERAGKRAFTIDAVREEILHVIRERSAPPRLPELARSFAMSERTFLRRIASEQISLRRMVAEARQDLAREMLFEEGNKVKYISKKLGYSDPSSFVRSFYRENGLSPGQWRAENLQK